MDGIMKDRNKPDNWYEAINEISDILYKNNVKFFIDSGTLLGFIRSSDFIEWDNDIDLGVIVKENSVSKLVKLLKKEYGSILETKYALYITVKSVDVGLNLYKKENNDYVTGYWSIKTNKKIKSFLVSLALTKLKIVKRRAYFGIFGEFKNLILNLLASFLPSHFSKILYNKFVLTKTSCVDTKIIGIPTDYTNGAIKTCIPEYNEQYLEIKYGRDWKTPKQDYNYIEDDGTLSK